MNIKPPGRKKRMDQKDNQPEKPGPFWSRIPSWVWWVLLGAVVIWNLFSFLPTPPPTTAVIPYSTFLDQVNANNVTSATMQDRSVTGQFRNPIAWPPATPAATTTGGTPVPATTPGPLVSNFSTTLPAVDDPRLLPLLEDHHVTVNVVQPSTGIIGLLSFLPLLLLVGLMAIPLLQARRAQNSIFSFGRSRAQNVTVDRPDTSFNDVAGQDEAKRELAEIVDFLKEPEKYLRLGARIPRGVLLVGPPGSGKTLLARAVAGEAGVPFFQTSGSEFVEMFVGVGASRVRDLFTRARSSAPAILFIDEIDAVGRQRGAGIGGGNDEREQTLNQLLVEMDGFDRTEAVVIIAATNRPDVLDPALLRPGRFDRQVTIGMPDRAGRAAILKIHSRQVPLAPDVDLDVIARGTPGFSGADLANLVNEAALQAARRNHDRVTMEDFEYAQDRIMLGLAQPPLADKHEREVVAYHEGGHALVAGLIPEADPVRKVTIMPRGMALGVTEQLPVDDRRNYSRAYLHSRLAVMLGGRSAEEVVFGEITTGASNDLKEATRLARRMVTQFGMSDRVGAINVGEAEDQPFLGYEMTQNRTLSDEMAALIDEEVKRFVEEAHSRARQLLTDHRAALDELAGRLLKEETVGGEALRELLRRAGAHIPSVEAVREATGAAKADGHIAASENSRAPKQEEPHGERE